MLRRSDALCRLAIHATDGELGRVTDFYFDDERWTLRYFIVRTGTWLSGREVLLTPAVVREARWNAGELAVSLTMDQVRDSPDVSTERPVSRMQEIEFLRYYDLPPYWMLGTEMGGASIALDAAMRAAAAEAEQAGAEPPTHLRSGREVLGYQVEAADGAIGHVKDFLLDEADWRVRYLLVDTTTWWFGGEVLLAPEWVKRVSWGERCVRVETTRETIKTAPPYRADELITPEYEAALARHYGPSR
jgi:uncharacterized protein YrrD